MGDMADYYDERTDAAPYILPGARRRSTPKGKPVALSPKQKVRRLEAELDANLNLQQTLADEAQKLREEIRKADIPGPPPTSAGTMFRVEVQFTARGMTYTYLLTRSGGRWYTTGTAEDQKMFKSWEALCAWLNSTYWHGNLDQLEVKESRRWPTEHTTEPPF